jgi:phosphatidylinositol glycan class F
MFKSNSTLFAMFVTLIEFIASTVVVYFISFTFGAYLIDQFHETTLFSMLITSIIAMPVFMCCEHTNPFELLSRLFIRKEHANKLEAKLVNVSFGAVIGAWCGALVIPLDWDTWWQEWPISCCFGTLAGAVLGGLFSSFNFRSKIKLHL